MPAVNSKNTHVILLSRFPVCRNRPANGSSTNASDSGASL
jgi:hypothetical protein